MIDILEADITTLDVPEECLLGGEARALYERTLVALRGEPR